METPPRTEPPAVPSPARAAHAAAPSEARRWEPSTGYMAKRLFLGRPLATARLEHERLGKPTALAVFSSDNLSSVAYASEEILRVLIPAVGIAAFALVVPLSAVIVLIEAILIFSYRQTIKAYPSAGGAYIVTKDNLGLLPAQLAGVALLVDYVLTVSVSTAAGVQAISSVVPLAIPIRIGLSLFFVWLIAYGNLLGVRESGKIFAAPTYVFIGSLYLTIAMGLYEVLSGHLHAFSAQAQSQHGGLSLGVGAVALFVVLRAFASGGAAVTGVEAISNGVPAFKKPEWRNAQITLMWMGLILGGSFLAVSYLAYRLRVVPVADESKSLLAQIGDAVYGRSLGGHFLFLLLQVSTTLILILAANTSFADFPRLASFHAGDAFMPRQLTKRGHRLVFSNGIMALAAAASVVIVLFRASVTNMIPLYALGVFTSFTLSQTGMAKRHLRLREPRWRFGLFVNGLGAVSTLVVAIIIAIVKFSKGAWVVMVLVPLLVALLVRVNHAYEAEEEALLEGVDRIRKPGSRPHATYVVVDELDAKTLHAIQYAMTVRRGAVSALRIGTPQECEAFREQWSEAGLSIPLVAIPCEPGGDRSSCLRRFLLEERQPGRHVTVVIPGPARVRTWQRLRRGHSWESLARAVREVPEANVVVVREHGGAGHDARRGRMQVVPRLKHVVLIPVDRLDRSVLNAVEYARSIGATEVRALHAGADPLLAQRLGEQWGEYGRALDIPLDIEECADRNIVRSILQYVEQRLDDQSEISVVIPQREYASLVEPLLHDRTGRRIARALDRKPHLEVIQVPYLLESRRAHRGHRGVRRTEPGPPSSAAQKAEQVQGNGGGGTVRPGDGQGSPGEERGVGSPPVPEPDRPVGTRTPPR
jgi:amino acid transporter